MRTDANGQLPSLDKAQSTATNNETQTRLPADSGQLRSAGELPNIVAFLQHTATGAISARRRWKFPAG
jgi:hypothetical protein